MWNLVENKRFFLALPCSIRILDRSVPISSIPRAAVGNRSSRVRLPFAADVQTLLHFSSSANSSKLHH